MFDDIADSFDYKNKYAIVEYIRDITETEYFYQLILTHNYDFYRTVSSRLDLERKNKFHTFRNEDGVHIRVEKYQNNPFNHWKDQLPKTGNEDFLLAMIPFVRNIAEFSGQRDVEAALTKYLHIQEGSEGLNVGSLEELFKKVITFKSELSLSNKDKPVFDVLFDRAKAACALADEAIELESKIVLAMAIRIRSEKFMINRISDQAFVGGIKSNQTFCLLQKVEKDGLVDADVLKCLKQVTLMTPENIHINSFMYEPILDMSNHHLKKLYERVSNL